MCSPQYAVAVFLLLHEASRRGISKTFFSLIPSKISFLFYVTMPVQVYRQSVRVKDKSTRHSTFSYISAGIIQLDTAKWIFGLSGPVFLPRAFTPSLKASTLLREVDTRDYYGLGTITFFRAWPRASLYTETQIIGNLWGSLDEYGPYMSLDAERVETHPAQWELLATVEPKNESPSGTTTTPRHQPINQLREQKKKT